MNDRYEKEIFVRIFKLSSSLKKRPVEGSRIHIEYERIIPDEECIHLLEQRAEELRGHSSVNSTEKIQLVDSRTKFISAAILSAVSFSCLLRY